MTVPSESKDALIGTLGQVLTGDHAPIVAWFALVAARSTTSMTVRSRCVPSCALVAVIVYAPGALEEKVVLPPFGVSVALAG
jgi:hypothetical protein